MVVLGVVLLIGVSGSVLHHHHLLGDCHVAEIGLLVVRDEVLVVAGVLLLLLLVLDLSGDGAWVGMLLAMLLFCTLVMKVSLSLLVLLMVNLTVSRSLTHNFFR